MIELTLPEFDVDGKTTKDLVIMLLLKQHPLTAKQIWYKINRVFGRNISYQGIYKTATALIAGNVLRKNEIGYEIDVEWVKKVKRFAQDIEDNYGRAQPPNTIPPMLT